MAGNRRAELYTRYPLASVLVYNGTTALHFVIGGLIVLLAFGYSWQGYALAGLYLAFSFAEMYLLMPLSVCPSCVYSRLEGSLCVSGMNLVSRKVAGRGEARDFSKRAEGPLCPNNLYLAALVMPILVGLPALALGFSVLLLVALMAEVGLLLFRFFVIFPRMACVHCRAKFQCPQAGAMGVRDR